MINFIKLVIIFILLGCTKPNYSDVSVDNARKTGHTMTKTEKIIYTHCLNYDKPLNKYESYTPDTKLCECTTNLFLSKATSQEVSQAINGDWLVWLEAHDVCVKKLYTPVPVFSIPVDVYMM